MLRGKCCLVTGGAQGLGKAITEALLKVEAKVFITDINEDVLKKTTLEFRDVYGQHRVFSRQCDITKDIDDIFKDAHTSLGRLDIVANNAGILNEYDMDRTVTTNLLAVMKGTQLAVEYMSPDKGGVGGIIVNTSSTGGLYDVPHMPAYCAAKTGVIAYTTALSMLPEIAAKNIRMNCLCPGRIKTNMTDMKYIKTLMKPEELQTILEQAVMMTPEYVADGFMEIIKNTEMNGSCMKVTLDGGYEICKLKNSP